MEKVIEFVVAHPFLTALAVLLTGGVVKSVFSGGNKQRSFVVPEDRSGKNLKEVEDEKDDEDEKPDMTKITILNQAGRIIDEFTTETDSVSYDSSDGDLEFSGPNGKQIIYLLGNLSAKIVDL